MNNSRNKCGHSCRECPFNIEKVENCKIYSFYFRRREEVDYILQNTEWDIKELNIFLYELLYNNKCLNEIQLTNKTFEDIRLLIRNYINIGRKEVLVKCPNCGKMIKVPLCKYETNERCYCNNNCRDEHYRTGIFFKDFDIDKIKNMCDKAGLIYVKIERDRVRRDKSKIYYTCKKHPEKGVQNCLLISLKGMAKRGHCSCNLKAFTKEDLINDNRKDESFEIIGDYVNNSTPIKCKCLVCGKEFYLTPNKILNGRKCPKCNATLGEREVSKYLDEIGIEYIEQCSLDKCYHIKMLEYDFYLPEFNMVIEYMGQQHYEVVCFGGSYEKAVENFKQGQIRDKIKKEYCKEHNIRFIEIPYWEFDNIRIILSELFN